MIAFSVFGAAVAGTAYLAVQEIAEQGLKGHMASPDPAALHANVSQATIGTPPRMSGAPAAENAPPQRAAKPEFAETPPSPEVAVEPPQVTPLPEKPVPRKTVTVHRTKPSTRNNAASGEGEGGNKAANAAPEPAEAVAPPALALAPEPPVADRWETMNAALAACSRESFLAGLTCTERVRYQYCEGFWGQVPQCRAATRPGSSR